MHARLKYFTPQLLVFTFVLLHVLVWSITPILVRYNLPMDSIEGATWGQHLSWGYDKNPFLNGWLTALALKISHYQPWIIYLFSQIAVAIALLTIFALAKKMLPIWQAVISVMILECLQYFNFHAIDFNDNVLELPLWALTIYFFYLAVKHNRVYAWVLCGIFAGLSMMAKYYVLVLLLPMFAFLLSNRKYHYVFKTGGFYLALLSFLIIITPHFIWLFQHHFVTIKYVFERADNVPSLWNHIYFPLLFLWQQIEVLLPALILFSLFFTIFRTSPHDQNSYFRMPASFNRRFLIYMGLGPIIVTISISFLLGITLRAGWGMPLLSLFGIMMTMLFSPRLSTTALKAFSVVIFSLMFLFAIIYGVSLSRPNKSSANFPGNEISQQITRMWQHHFKDAPLSYVAGPRWLAGNISFYSATHPAVYMEWNPEKSFWINEDDLKKKGAIFVWDPKHPLSHEIIARFPDVFANAQAYEFKWKRNHTRHSKIILYVSLLPPSLNSS